MLVKHPLWRGNAETPSPLTLKSDRYLRAGMSIDLLRHEQMREPISRRVVRIWLN